MQAVRHGHSKVVSGRQADAPLADRGRKKALAAARYRRSGPSPNSHLAPEAA